MTKNKNSWVETIVSGALVAVGVGVAVWATRSRQKEQADPPPSNNAGSAGTPQTDTPKHNKPMNATDNSAAKNNGKGKEKTGSARSTSGVKRKGSKGDTETTGTGVGESDFVGTNSGLQVDDSIADTVAGGTSGGRTSVGAGIDNADMGTGGSDIGNAKMGNTEANILSGVDDTDDMPRSKNRATSPKSKAKGVKKKAAETGGAGSGAAMNDHGSRIHDIDAGTGSAQRGNQAGIEDASDGKIMGGTLSSNTTDAKDKNEATNNS